MGGSPYRGRGENVALHSNIKLLLSENKSYNMIINILNCARGTIAKVAKRQYS
jgi:hypothetical protein